MISGIIKVSVSVISLSLRLRLITLTSTLIDITKTSSNNCLESIIRSPSLFFNEYLRESKRSAIFHATAIARRKAYFRLRVSRILFEGHVAGFRPMKRRENLHRIILKDHSISPLLIISLIIITFSFDVSLLLVTLEKHKGLKTRGTGGGSCLGYFFLGMCRWPLRTPTPL